MAEPSLALQAVIVAALKVGSTDDIISGRIYDRVPRSPTFPYVRIGDGDQVIAAKAECFEGSRTVYTTLNAFSRPQEDATNTTQPRGKVEVKQLAGAIVDDLDEAELSPDGYRLVIFEHEQTEFTADPDGLTEHAIITFRAELDPI